MKSTILKGILLFAFACATLSYDVPKGWYKAGNQPDKYDMGTDRGAGRNNNNAATIKSLESDIKGFGTLMQTFLPDKYIGKRVKLTAYMKSKDVAGWAGMWMRVDGKKKGKSLSFDNMADRAIKGTTDWAKCEIVLDVPTGASNIAYGALLSGTGQIWFEGINFEIVPESMPTTETLGNRAIKEPTNLNFDK
jgi:hypothetical protein